MEVLLDTHFLIWLAKNDISKMSKSALTMINDVNNTLYYSKASLWEISIKNKLGKPEFSINIQRLEKGLLQAGFKPVIIDTPHFLQTMNYPLLHKDPFDRLLIAQADVENLQLLTADTAVLDYRLPFILK